MRLAWIDALRDAVAEFLSLDAEIKGTAAERLGHEFRDNLVQRRLMIRHCIEFRLDPAKDLHVDLLGTLDAILGANPEGLDAGTLERSARALTVSIAEGEWRRVRREVGAPVSGGEPTPALPGLMNPSVPPATPGGDGDMPPPVPRPSLAQPSGRPSQSAAPST